MSGGAEGRPARLIREEETGEPFRVPCCASCTAQAVDKDGVPLTDRALNRKKHVCADCGSPLWQADDSGPARYPLSDYVKHHMRGLFDLLVGDEMHEFKARGSAQGIAVVVLADACGKSLSLTGTLLGGYASTIFHLLYRFSPEIRTKFGRSDEGRRIKRNGFDEDGRNSSSRKYRRTVRERPWLVPSALFHIIGNTIFLRFSDVASGLPDFEEQVLLSSMNTEEDSTGYSQRTAYNTVFEELRAELAKALKAGSKRLLATYLQILLAYPDGCTNGETVFDPRTGDVIVQVPPLRKERLYPKERALVDLVAAERMASRRVLVYVTHTGTRDITGRMEDILTRHGFRVAVMKADAVEPKRREAWVADKVKQGIDVMVCHPRLVQTGLDLTDFPTLCWFETDYSVYVSRQASRRSWRIGQTHAVKVVYMSYKNTLQADALKLMAKKLQSSLAVEGELPEDGLAAYGDEGDDMMMALARKIVSGEGEDEAETMEEVFTQTRDAESAAEELLVDDGWKAVEVQPETIGANGNGATGHSDLFGVGPTVELVPAIGHNANRYGPTRMRRSLSRRCSLGPSCWQSRSSRSAATASPSPRPSRCSSGRWSWNGKERPNPSALDARPQTAGKGCRLSASSPRPPMYVALLVFEPGRSKLFPYAFHREARIIYWLIVFRSTLLDRAHSKRVGEVSLWTSKLNGGECSLACHPSFWR
ncbi:MAG: hypothetical protein OXP10_01280 [Chloroflexota bacterium]|nr:hypothetical protein [Chloroflexota bacterium]MDE2940967.1 hypothetical protein [Chloroflexota bacterium]